MWTLTEYFIMGENLLKEIEKGSKMAVMKKKIITHYIYNGSSTITDLAREMDLSVPTVTKFIDEMCEEGYINDYGKLETSGGRHPSLYGLNADSGYFVGVEVRQFSINLGLINFKGDVVQLKMNVPFKAKNTPESLDELCKLIKHFLQKVSVEKDKILNINVNLSGRVNPDLGYSYSIFNFDERPLTDVISEKVGGYRVSIDNDTRAMIYGEYMQGVVKGEKNIIFINVSWGLGMGIIIDGKIYKGKSGFSGEFGHNFGYENEIICNTKKNLEDLTLDDIIDAVNKEDLLCIELVEEIGVKLGRHLAGLINIFNPELVIIGGALSRTGDYLTQPITTAIRKYTLNLMNRDSVIVESKLKERAGIIGACMLSRSKLFE